MGLRIKVKDGSDSPEINYIRAIIFSQKDCNVRSSVFSSRDGDDIEREFFLFKERVPEIRKIR